MPSADSCATVGSPLDFPSSNTGTMTQFSPGKSDRLRRTPAGFTALVLMDLDFAIRCPLVRPRMPHIRFLSVRSRLCSTLPSDAFARPCASLVLHLHQVGQETFTPQRSNMLGTHRDRGTPRGAAPPTPPGIRVAYLGGSTGLCFNAQDRGGAGRESRRHGCAVPSEPPDGLTCANTPSANRRQPPQGIAERLYGAAP